MVKDGEPVTSCLVLEQKEKDCGAVSTKQLFRCLKVLEIRVTMNGDLFTGNETDIVLT
jgi:hypothetical protein